MGFTGFTTDSANLCPAHEHTTVCPWQRAQFTGHIDGEASPRARDTIVFCQSIVTFPIYLRQAAVHLYFPFPK
jgi:hypothetical protein